MDFEEFCKIIRKEIIIDMLFENPGGGTSRVIDITSSDFIVYQRKASKIRVNIIELYKVYTYYKGKNVSSSDLKSFKPNIFSTKENGHDCNCSLIFLILNKIGLASEILGRGKRGDPFYVFIK